MSLYKRPEANIQRELDKFLACDHPTERMRMDISDVLTGPTSGAEAQRLASTIIDANNPREVALAFIEIGMRYLKDSK